jgi:hypothetical protein
MVMCDGNKVRVYVADNASACTIAKQFARTWAVLWEQMRVWALLGPLKCLEEGVCH